jgi:hypothetical protein
VIAISDRTARQRANRDERAIAESTGLVGDYNGNGIVDAADYIVWRKNQGTTHMLPNDSIGGTIGAAQYDQWRAHFGQTAGSVADAIANAAVPVAL